MLMNIRTILLLLLANFCFAENVYMSKEEKNQLKEKVLEMFDHAYNSYKDYAFPADELMPLSCKGRYRGSERDRGDIDEALGNFSLTLIDTLDTLARFIRKITGINGLFFSGTKVLGKLDEFDRQVEYVIKNVSFDTDVVVSVFETNIRVVGGLLGAHTMALALRENNGRMPWYKDQLLVLAQDIADRLLPAFNTTTGIPYPKVNLRYGVNTPKARVGHETDTCTACAGTMIMEFGALSRLTGDPRYEEKAHQAMEALWNYRSIHTNLVGTVINIHNGNWIRRDSGVGAGIDSYYEYCLKAYILFGDEWYLEKFNRHYAAINRYVRNGFMLVDVLMNEPLKKIRSHMDALQAFWPGLQVLKGDLQSAIETHEMLYTVAKKFKFLPEHCWYMSQTELTQLTFDCSKSTIETLEKAYLSSQLVKFSDDKERGRDKAFTTDFNVHWAQHPLRPEFVESTYFLYEATKDPHYLNVGKHVIESLENYARVACGFAALKDLRTLSHEDKMDSFVLAETFKYLYLLFSEESEREINIHDYVFTTEAHLLPLYLSTVPSDKTDNDTTENENPVNELRGFSLRLDEDLPSCPNHRHGINDMLSFARKVRKNVKNSIPSHQTQPICSNQPPVVSAKIVNEKDSEKILSVIRIASNRERKLKADQFIMDNQEHLKILKDFGISIHKGDDGKVQLMHQAANAATGADAEEGLLFMKEMIELSKQKGTIAVETNPRVVQLMSPPYKGSIVLTAGSAQFGADLTNNKEGLLAEVVEGDPFRACGTIKNGEEIKNRIVLIERGECMFIDKVRLAQGVGALGVIIIDHTEGTSIETSQQFSMSGDSNPEDVHIPSVFLFKKEGNLLRQFMKSVEGKMQVRIAAKAVREKEDEKQESTEQGKTDTDDNASTLKETLTSKLLKNQDKFDKADKQLVHINEDGSKSITTISSFIGPNDNNVLKKYIQKKIETCPTSECNHGVQTKYEFSTEDAVTETTADTESKDIAKPKTDQLNDENYIENFFSKALNAKANKDGSICTSAGCFESSEEHDKMNSLADGILDSLKQLQNKLESSVVNLLDEIRDKHKDINHPKAKQEFEKIRQFLNNEQAAQVLHGGDTEQQNRIQNAKENLKEPTIVIEKNKENEKKAYKDEYKAAPNADDTLASEKQLTITEDTNSGTETIKGNVSDNETELNNVKNSTNKEKSNSKQDSDIEDDVDPNTRTREDL